ncbi:MAG: hypothetical protein ABSC93_26530, partial [Bryobacteraceae bacterium]
KWIPPGKPFQSVGLSVVPHLKNGPAWCVVFLHDDPLSKSHFKRAFTAAGKSNSESANGSYVTDVNVTV